MRYEKRCALSRSSASAATSSATAEAEHAAASEDGDEEEAAWEEESFSSSASAGADADARSFADIEREIGRLAGLATSNRLTIADLTGGTFTISNGGIYGSMLSTPILNPPQSGILGLHNIVERPVAVNGKVEIRPIMYLALSYDHRIVDGREAVQFLVDIKASIEDPRRLMLEV